VKAPERNAVHADLDNKALQARHGVVQWLGVSIAVMGPRRLHRSSHRRQLQRTLNVLQYIVARTV